MESAAKPGSFPLDRATLHTLGASLTAHLREKLEGRAPVILTGRDTRESGDWLEQALVEGAASCRRTHADPPA